MLCRGLVASALGEREEREIRSRDLGRGDGERMNKSGHGTGSLGWISLIVKILPRIAI